MNLSIISVGKQIIYFSKLCCLCWLFGRAGFAHAFYILLLPKSDVSFEKPTNGDDPNNPWNIAPTYKQVLGNGSIDSNTFIIQPPNENTNMFIDFRTALFAMYLFLTGTFKILCYLNIFQIFSNILTINIASDGLSIYDQLDNALESPINKIKS